MSRKGGYQIIDFKGLRLEEDIVSDKLRNLILKSDKVLLVSGLKDGSKLLPDCICSKRVLTYPDHSIPDTILLISNDKVFEIYGEENLVYCYDTKLFDITPYMEIQPSTIEYVMLETGQGTEMTRVTISLDLEPHGINISKSLLQVQYSETFVPTENDDANASVISFYLYGLYDSDDNPIDLSYLRIFVQL